MGLIESKQCKFDKETYTTILSFNDLNKRF